MSQINGPHADQSPWVGQEISCRIVIPIFQTLEEKALSVELALKGVGFPLTHLRDKHQWISWDTYVQILENLAGVFTDQDWERVGYRTVTHQFFRPMVLMLRYLKSPISVFEYGTVKDGKLVGHRMKDRMLFSCMEARVRQVGRTRLEYTVEMEAGYEGHPIHYLTLVGGLKALSTIHGDEPAEVSLKISFLADKAIYQIHLSSYRPVRNRMWRWISFLLPNRPAVRELELTLEELQEQNIKLQAEIVRRKAAEEALYQIQTALEDEVNIRTEALQQTNDALEKFVHLAAHDLKEPVRMVHMYLQLLEQKNQGQLTAESQDFLGFAQDGAKQLISMLNSILDISRFHREPISFEFVDLNRIVHQLLRVLGPKIEETQAEVYCEKLPVLKANPGQMTQVFQNLIGNALKFSADHPVQVKIFAKELPEEWQFTVQDNGIGIEVEYQKSIFDMFRRLHSRKQFEGSGIGLSICKEIVRLHGGKIWVQSPLSNGQAGAAFMFTLAKDLAYAEQSLVPNILNRETEPIQRLL